MSARVIGVETYPHTADLASLCPGCGEMARVYVDYDEPPGWQLTHCSECSAEYLAYWSRDRGREARRHRPTNYLMSRVLVERRVRA